MTEPTNLPPEPSAHRDNAREDAVNAAQGTTDAAQGTAKRDVVVPALGPKGMLRWAWTQLTSMRTALMLLLLLAVAAVPGSIFPQRVQDAAAVEAWIEDNPTLGPILDALQMFEVYSSVWFSAIYLLLFISLIGCIIPRARKHIQQMRSAPPRTPRRLQRMPEYGAVELDDDGPAPQQTLDDAAKILKKRGYRVERRETSVAAEKGYLKEVGNILFHVSLVGVLIFV